MKNISLSIGTFATKALCVGVFAASLSALAQAAEIKQQASAGANQSWLTASLWENSAPASAGNDYFTNGYNLRSPDLNSGTATFPGGSLTISGGTGGARSVFQLKASVVRVENLTLGNGNVANQFSPGGTNRDATLSVGTLRIAAEATSESAAVFLGTYSGHNLTLAAENLVGSGYVRFGGTQNNYVDIASASGFTGEMNVASGALELKSALSLGSGVFSMNTGSSLVLSYNLSVASFSFAGSQLSSGSYSSAELNSHFNTSAFSGGGTLSVIPEASTTTLLGVFGVCVVALLLRRRR